MLSTVVQLDTLQSCRYLKKILKSTYICNEITDEFIQTIEIKYIFFFKANTAKPILSRYESQIWVIFCTDSSRQHNTKSTTLDWQER